MPITNKTLKVDINPSHSSVLRGVKLLSKELTYLNESLNHTLRVIVSSKTEGL